MGGIMHAWYKWRCLWILSQRASLRLELGASKPCGFIGGHLCCLVGRQRALIEIYVSGVING